MKKDIHGLLHTLDELKTIDLMKNVTIGKPLEYHVKEQWFSDKESKIPNADCNGIYFYTKKNGEVLYIGKGEFKRQGGIGHRACAHLGAAIREQSDIFPYHRWIDDEKIPLDIRELIKKGDFCIWTLPVEPDFFVSLIEVYLQTSFKQVNNNFSPPLLNKRIG